MMVATTNRSAPAASGTAIQKCHTCSTASDMFQILGPWSHRLESLAHQGFFSRSNAREILARSSSGTESTQRLFTTIRSSASKS